MGAQCKTNRRCVASHIWVQMSISEVFCLQLCDDVITLPFLPNASTYIAITLISLVLKRGDELNVFALLNSPYQTSTVLFVLMKEHVFRIWQGLNVHI